MIKVNITNYTFFRKNYKTAGLAPNLIAVWDFQYLATIELFS